MDYKEIVEKALEAREKAYCPYSNFKVGAAVLFEDGNISYETLSKYFIDSVEFRLNTLVYITEEKMPLENGQVVRCTTSSTVLAQRKVANG
jgi:hypothetical protein